MMAHKQRSPVKRVIPRLVIPPNIKVHSRQLPNSSAASDLNLPSDPRLITYDIFEKKSVQQLLYKSAQERVHPERKWTKFITEIGKHIANKKYIKGLVKDLDETKQWSPLHYAVFNNNTYVYDRLTDKKNGDDRFSCDMKLLTVNGENVLHVAARSSFLWHTASPATKAIESIVLVGDGSQSLPKIISTLVHRGADVNHPDDEGRTPLHLAIMENRLAFVKFLLNNNNANIYATTKLGANVLHFIFIPNEQSASELSAMFKYMTAKLRPPIPAWHLPWLNEQKRLARMRTFDNRTPLVLAVCHPQVTGEIIQVLLDERKNYPDGPRNRATTEAPFPSTQIFIAVAQVARLRLTSHDHLRPVLHICSINKLNQLFHFPCLYNNDIFLKWLVEESSKVYEQRRLQGKTQEKLDLNQRDHAGYTPLLTAVFYKSTACVKYLLQYSTTSTRTNTTTSSLSVQIDQVNVDGENILHICAKNCLSKDFLDIIWDSTAKLELLKQQDGKGNLPLHVAAANNQMDLCERFLTAVEGSFQLLSHKNVQGQTPAHIATVAVPRRIGPERTYINKHEKAKHQNAKASQEDNDDGYDFGLPMLEMMWKNSSGKDRRGGLFELDDDRKTCLHLAATKGHQKIVRFLVKQVGIEIDAIADRRVTPLHLACEHGHGEIIAYLIENGASPALRNADLYNSLEIAIVNQNEKAVKELLTLSNWRELMRNAQRIDHSEGYDTPMRKLIRYMPEVAIWMIEEKLTRTLGGQGRHVFKNIYDYEFYMDISQVKQWHTQGVRVLNEEESFSERCYRRGCTALCCCQCGCAAKWDKENNDQVPYTDDAYTLIRNHPLIIASEQSQCPALIQHPYNTFLRDEWYRRNGHLFYAVRGISFVLYAAFLAIWTAVILLGKHPQYFYDKAGYNMTLDLDLCAAVSRSLTAANDPEALKTTVYKNLKLTVFVFLVLFVVQNIILIITLFPRIFRTIDYILEISGFVLTFVYLLDWADWQSPVIFRCPVQYQLGSMGLLLTWISMLSYIKRTTLFDMGVFVVMIQLIGLKFIRFIPVLLIIVCGFGFTHWMLLQNQIPFQNPADALLRTAFLMFDLGYEDHLYNKTVYYQIIYLITILSAIVFCIFVLNLLISVAVGEIPSLTVQGKIWQSKVLYDLLSDYSIVSIQLIRFSDFISCGLMGRRIFQGRLRPILVLEHNRNDNWHQKAHKYVQNNFFDEKIQDDIIPSKSSNESKEGTE